MEKETEKIEDVKKETEIKGDSAQKKSDKNKKKVVIAIIVAILILIIAFVIWFFNRKFEVTFDPNNGTDDYIVKVKYNKLVNDDDIKTSDELGEGFINWYKVVINEDGEEVLEEKPFDFDTKIKKCIVLRAVYEGAPIEEVPEVVTTEPTTVSTTKSTKTTAATTTAAPTTAAPTTTTTSAVVVTTTAAPKPQEDKLKITATSSKSNCASKTYSSDGDFWCYDKDGEDYFSLESSDVITLVSTVPVTWDYTAGVTIVSKSDNKTVVKTSISGGAATITGKTELGQKVKVSIMWSVN